MTEDVSENGPFAEAHQTLQRIRTELNKVLIGQSSVIDEVLVALLAGGHVLIEGVPGLGKTLLVKSLAKCFDGQFKRIQFTPDLMPSDITGHALYDMNEGKFRLRQGPVFTNLLLADEINRAPAKTQAALLEVMQENSVTIEGGKRDVPLPFMVLATQNPIEQEGTFPLPEAELDRFLMKVFIDYPSLDDERKFTQAVTQTVDDEALQKTVEKCLDAADIERLQSVTTQVTVDEQVLDYAVRIVRSTRESTLLHQGAGPRASIGMIRSARAQALLEGRDFVTPDDLKTVSYPVLRHRISLTAESEIDGQTPDGVLKHLLETIAAPRI